MRGSMLLLPFLTRILFPTAVQHHDAPLAPGQTFTGACLLANMAAIHVWSE